MLLEPPFLPAKARGDRGRLRRNLFTCTAEGICATPLVWASVPANLIIAALLTQVFALDNATYGLIAALPSVFNGLQIFIVPLLARQFSPKALSIAGAWLHLAFWAILLLALPWLPRDDATRMARIFFVFFLITSAVGSISGVTWTAWVQDWVPLRVRGTYFGRRNRIVSLVTMTYLLFAAAIMEYSQTGLTAYLIVLGLAVLLRVPSVLWQQRIESPPGIPKSPRSLLAQLHKVRGNRPFLVFVAFIACAGFLMNVVGPFVPIFLYEHLQFPVGLALLLVVISSLTGAAGMPLWGRLTDRYGYKPVIAASLILWEVPNYLFVILTPDNTWILYLLWAWGGFVSAGFHLGAFGLLLKLIDPEVKTAAVSLHVAVTSAAAALGPMLAGFLLSAAAESGGDLLFTYRIIFAVKTTLLLATVLILRHLVEPRAGRLTDLFGGLRTLRQLAQNSGLAWLANVFPVQRR